MTVQLQGSLISDKTEVLAEWERHFRELSTSSSQSIPQIAEAEVSLTELEILSRMNSDMVLDDEITMEEIESAIRTIKRGKRGGMDNISAEHLQHGGELPKVWPKQVFNAVISF